jgi:hypothetical protein
MQMSGIWICLTYPFLLFFTKIRKNPVPDLLSAPRRAAAPAGHILWSPSLSCRGDTPYVVFHPVPDDRALHTGKRRFAYFPAVVHFRKVGIRQKVGSAGNGSPVIYRRGYMDAYCQPENDDGTGKLSG